MDPAYIAALAEAYDRYFLRYARTPLLAVDATEMGFVGSERDRAELLRRIASAARAGTNGPDSGRQRRPRSEP